jgi:hypothetical protein
MSGKIKNNCPDQFSLLGHFKPENLWTKEILLPKNKPSLIVMATDGFEENHPIWEMMTAMKDLTNKLKPTDIINEVMTKTGHYSDDMTLVCTRIIP